MREGKWLAVALAVVAAASGPAALLCWNQVLGLGGFATPVGGEKWYATHPGFFEAQGLRDPELSPRGDVYNWTADGEATLRFPRLERAEPAQVTVRIKAMPPIGDPAPEVIFSVDGVVARREPLPLVPKRVSLDLPPRLAPGAVISIKVEGGRDVIVENVRLTSQRGPLPIPRESFLSLAFIALAGFAAGLSGRAGPWRALLIAAGVAGVMAFLSIRGGSFLGPYSGRVIGLGFLGLLFSLAALPIRDLDWRRATIAVIWTVMLKLAILGHPSMADGDASGHAVKFGRVLSGEWLFTSNTPPPAISFPYPPGLPVAAMPFSFLPVTQWVTVLRTVALIADTMAAALFGLTVAGLSTSGLGALTFLCLALSPDGTGVLFNGNLSDLFSAALVLAGCSFLIRKREVLAGVALLSSFLSHFSALLLGAPLSFVVALSPSRRGESFWRRVAPVGVALLVSFVFYYRYFVAGMLESLNRMLHLQASGVAGPMTAPVSQRLARWVGGADWWITAVTLIGVTIGVATWPKNRASLTDLLSRWSLVIAGFAILGLLTPVQLRLGLSARPVVAALLASGLGALWTGSGRGRTLALILISLTAASSWTIAVHYFAGS